jgi:hypothetical protein
MVKGDVEQLDPSKVAYFEQKFEAFDAEELGDLVSRRSGLADEAVEALDRILVKKGLKDTDVFLVPQATNSSTTGKGNGDVATFTKNSRELWRGRLAMGCKLFVAFTFTAPVQIWLKSVTIGALWAGLAVLIVGYTGYYVGHLITLNICSNADASVKAKRTQLWIMLAMLFPIYIFVYVIFDMLLGRR